MIPKQPTGTQPRWRLDTHAIVIATLVIAGFYLITTHPNQMIALLPYGFILVCPLMMFFMMRGMHNGQASSDASTGHSQQHSTTPVIDTTLAAPEANNPRDNAGEEATR